jgi:hypothetical protein
MAIYARFDKQGRRLPDSGRGCGCQQCAESHAARYERRRGQRRIGTWGPWRRRLLMAMRELVSTGPPQAV